MDARLEPDAAAVCRGRAERIGRAAVSLNAAGSLVCERLTRALAPHAQPCGRRGDPENARSH